MSTVGHPNFKIFILPMVITVAIAVIIGAIFQVLFVQYKDSETVENTRQLWVGSSGIIGIVASTFLAFITFYLSATLRYSLMSFQEKMSVFNGEVKKIAGSFARMNESINKITGS